MNIKRTAFDIVHPGIALLYFGAVLILSMSVFHPVFLLVNVVAGFGYHCYLKGVEATAKTLVWQLPLLLIITVFNPLFVSAGSTELFRIGTQAIYFESLAYGFCMGLLLMSTLLWFSNASSVLGSDKIMTVFGKRFRIIGLMITMIMRLIPQFTQRGKAIYEVNSACSAAYPKKKPSALSMRLRQVTTLMSWSMEDSLETSDAMKAKGWASTSSRTQYQRYSHGMFDYLVGIAFLMMVVLDIVGAFFAGNTLRFYPIIQGVLPCWGIISHAIVLGLPLYLELYIRIRS